MRTLLPALLLFAVSVGCEQEDGEAQKGAAEGAPPEVIARCGELAGAIEAMLGPKFEKPVPVRLVDKKFIDGFARETVARTVPKETERQIERLAVRLKQIPADCSMLETQIRLLQLFAAGFYDPHRHCYYVIKGKAEPGTAGFDVTAALAIDGGGNRAAVGVAEDHYQPHAEVDDRVLHAGDHGVAVGSEWQRRVGRDVWRRLELAEPGGPRHDYFRHPRSHDRRHPAGGE